MTHAITRPVVRPVSRFLDAQRVVYPRILKELQSGRKRTHWMWFVFPQLRALAKSETAHYYGLADRDEALAYLDDSVLRLRLAECTVAVLNHPRLILSHPDNRKLQASMTLFSQVVVDPTLPNAVLTKFFDGPDQRTLDVLAGKTIAPQTAMGRVEVGRHWEKQIARARATVASIGEAPERGDAEPMSRAEVESFVKGFGMAAAATRRMVAGWMADQDRARNAGWESHADSVWYDQG